MNYSSFRYKAVVDYIEIRVTLCEPSCVPGMRARSGHKGHTGLDRVLPINPDEGGAATVFDLCIQDPQRYSDVQAVLQRLGRHKAFACAPVVWT